VSLKAAVAQDGCSSRAVAGEKDALLCPQCSSSSPRSWQSNQSMMNMGATGGVLPAGARGGRGQGTLSLCRLLFIIHCTHFSLASPGVRGGL